jgi:hypothetical protein
MNKAKKRACSLRPADRHTLYNFFLIFWFSFRYFLSEFHSFGCKFWMKWVDYNVKNSSCSAKKSWIISCDLQKIFPITFIFFVFLVSVSPLSIALSLYHLWNINLKDNVVISFDCLLKGENWSHSMLLVNFVADWLYDNRIHRTPGFSRFCLHASYM